MELVFLRPLQGPSTSWTLDVLKGHINCRHAASLRNSGVCDGSSCVYGNFSLCGTHTYICCRQMQPHYPSLPGSWELVLVLLKVLGTWLKDSPAGFWLPF